MLEVYVIKENSILFICSCGDHCTRSHYLTDKLHSRSLLHLKEAIRSITLLMDQADDAS